MSQPADQIAHWRKMATDDPDNDLAHYRLGQELMRAGQLDEAVRSFRRTLEISPEFSKVFQLLGDSLVKLGRREEAIKALLQGFDVADQRGDYMPRDEMSRMLVAMGEAAPQSKKAADHSDDLVEGDFRCQSQRHKTGPRGRQLLRPPFSDELGQRIYQTTCVDCWNEWLHDYGKKVVNELRLDLSSEAGQAEYDRYMREFLGLD